MFAVVTGLFLLQLSLHPLRAEEATSKGALALSPAAPSLPSSFAWQSDTQGAFVSSMARNPRTGEVWFGVEDQGVYRYDPRAAPLDRYESGRWSNLRTENGLGDNNAYALVVDPKGRVWAGTRAHGVSVTNGQAWRSYDVLSGPMGERVFALAVSPLDGDVWIGTNRGLTRYSQKSDTWRTFSRLDSLPSDQIQALGFAKDGTLFVGTQCDGLAIGQATDDYKAWRSVRGPERMPQTARGSGLPSNLINAILVAGGGTVYVATPCGLARSRDEGKSWLFLRGRDYADKIRGQYKRPDALDIQEVRDGDMDEESKSNLLLEDYVTALAEDETGRLWLGHPTQGIEARTPGAEEFAAGGVVETLGEWRRILWQHRRVVAVNPLEQEEKTDYVMSILPVPGQGPLVSAYGAGAVQLRGGAMLPPTVANTVHEETIEAPLPAFPSPAAPPSIEEMRALLVRIQALQTPTPPHAASAAPASVPAPVPKPNAEAKAVEALSKPGAAPQAPVAPQAPAPIGPVWTPRAGFIGDDWITGGDWIGRYGTRLAFLGAMTAPLDHRVVNDLSYTVEGRIGPHPYQDGKSYAEQNLRHWTHRERWDDPRVLYNPLIGYRRQADVDDNGEEYPLFYEGPDVWMGVRVPPGVHRCALYFFNKDGQQLFNRLRDFEIEVKRGHEDLLQSEAEPALARARVRDFWGGVYKVFTLDGGATGGDYFFWIRKDTSFDTILQGVFLDKLSGPPTQWEERRDVFLGQTRFEAPTSEQRRVLEAVALTATKDKDATLLEAALDVWQALDDASDRRDFEAWQSMGRVQAYRAALAACGQHPSGQALLRSWRWTLPLWPAEDRDQFDKAMKMGWDSFKAINPDWTEDVH